MKPAVRVASIAIVWVWLAAAGFPAATAQRPTAFASRIAALSEPAGYFDTDNLISNESSYLQVLPALRRGNVRGGAYIGVGPDQNFTYIADIRPEIAFIIDVRRDNLLLHLLLKALFGLSRTRAEYVALLFGRPVPPNVEAWGDASVSRLAQYIDHTTADAGRYGALRTRVDTAIRKFGVPLSGADLATIDRFHRRFVDAGLGLQFNSAGRPPRSHYPTYGEMLLDTDPDGRAGNYLASEDAFQFVKALQARDLIVPVVGDLSGASALAAIGRLLTERRQRLSAFYASNVEYYLFRNGSYPQFVRNLRAIPHTSEAVVIRSIFNVYGGSGARPGDSSASVVQRLDDLLKGVADRRIQTYGDLVYSR